MNIDQPVVTVCSLVTEYWCTTLHISLGYLLYKILIIDRVGIVLGMHILILQILQMNTMNITIITNEYHEYYKITLSYKHVFKTK